MKKIPLIYAMLVVVCLSFVATDVFAVTAWARKYGFDCTVCHWNVYKLNKTGQDFLRTGHQMFKEDASGKSLSDYLSLTAKIRYNTFKKDTFEEHAFSVYTGGPLDKGFSYFAEMYLHENSGNTSGTSDFNDFGRSKLAEAFLQYTYGDEKKFTTARFGQIVSQLLYIHGVGGRFGKDRAMVLTSTFGANPYKPFQRNYGAEVGQYYKGFMGALGVVNGTGGSLFNVVDANQHKDVYATLDYEFTKEGSIVGLYGYLGKLTRSGFDDKFFQVGPMFNYLSHSFTLSGLALFGRNTKNIAKDKAHSIGGYLEAGYKAYSDILTPYLRYDYFDADQNDGIKNHGPVAGLVWRPFTYGRFVGEFTHIQEERDTDTGQINKFSLEAQYMF